MAGHHRSNVLSRTWLAIRKQGCHVLPVYRTPVIDSREPRADCALKAKLLDRSDRGTDQGTQPAGKLPCGFSGVRSTWNVDGCGLTDQGLIHLLGHLIIPTCSQHSSSPKNHCSRRSGGESEK